MHENEHQRTTGTASAGSVLGGRIQSLRSALGLSLGAVGRRSGVSKAYLSQLENGLSRRPSAAKLNAIAAALHVSASELQDPAAAVAVDSAISPALREMA